MVETAADCTETPLICGKGFVFFLPQDTQVALFDIYRFIVIEYLYQITFSL